MLTLVVRVNPKMPPQIRKNIMDDLRQIGGSNVIPTIRWSEGLKHVKTPFVCLVESDCSLSVNFLVSMMNILENNGHNPLKRTGGYLKLAMIGSAIGNNFQDRIYGYKVHGDEVSAVHDATSSGLHHPQIGFVPGSILRYSSIKKDIDSLPWDESDLVKMSCAISLHLWDTNRRIQINPEVTYVTNYHNLTQPRLIAVPDKVKEIFVREGL